MAFSNRMPPPKPMGAITVAFGKKMDGDPTKDEGTDAGMDQGDVPGMLSQIRDLCDQIESKMMGEEKAEGEDMGGEPSEGYPTT